jgi:hypothetical protein
MDFTGKPMRSMVYVAATGIATRDALEAWVHRAIEFVAGLPPK